MPHERECCIICQTAGSNSAPCAVGVVLVRCTSGIIRAVCDVKVSMSLHATVPSRANRRASGSPQKPKYPHYCSDIITDVYPSDRHDNRIKQAFLSLSESVFEMPP